MDHRRPILVHLLVASLLLAGCGDGGGDGAAAPGTTDTTTGASSSSSSSTSTSTSMPVDDDEHVAGGLAGADELVDAVVGATYAQARATEGIEAHQRSDFGTKGSWTLFTVEHDGDWYAFTTTNTAGTLADDSKIVTGERLRPLAGDDWYGVSGVVRNGRPIGGVMMHGSGQRRESDGTYPVLDAWRVNLQTLRLEPSPVEGLDIVEACG